jgi:hypothetical protein
MFLNYVSLCVKFTEDKCSRIGCSNTSEMIDWGRFIVTRFTVMLEGPSMSMNTRVSRNEAQTRWNTEVWLECLSLNLVNVSKLLSVVNNFGLVRIFMETFKHKS